MSNNKKEHLLFDDDFDPNNRKSEKSKEIEEKKTPVVYDEDKIETLDALEHIRRRPGMYIGRLGDGTNPDDGIYILLKEVIDNSIDEFIMGYGNKIDIKLEDKTLSIRDYGRGIPLGKVVDCVSIINTGAKYNNEVFQFSVGLNGVGTKAVNALSETFTVCSYRDKEYVLAKFEYGKLIHQEKGKTEEPNGTFTQFKPDGFQFKDFSFDENYITQRLFNYSCLNKGLTLFFNDKVFFSKNGLKDLLEENSHHDHLYDIQYYTSKDLEFALTHTSHYDEIYYSFVNGQYTSDGGTHLSAFKEGLIKGINEFFKKNYQRQDLREGILGAISIKVQEPIFESQTKNKLGNTNIKTDLVKNIKEIINDFLHKNEIFSSALGEKLANNERLRKELSDVRKAIREGNKKSSLNISQLKDCKLHKGDKKNTENKTTIFLTEGQSASGSLISCRDVFTQAIFSLKGKPFNTHDKLMTEVYKNDELFNLMRALGIDNDINKLRYDRIIIATDADDDGYHIRNLLLTYFLTFFRELVSSNYLYILETPLFRVRNSKKTIYCYNERERDKAMNSLKNNEVTRFKGLGEISPKEFGQFIGDDIKLIPVQLNPNIDIHYTLNFYMGKNTPDRREYIVNNLLTEV